jgi:hypothetical protein
MRFAHCRAEWRKAPFVSKRDSGALAPRERDAEDGGRRTDDSKICAWNRGSTRGFAVELSSMAF